MGNRFLRPLFFSVVLFAAAAGGDRAFAQASAGDSRPAETAPDSGEREALANRYVHEILPYWQQRLQLNDWTVFVLLARPADLRKGTLGNIHWDVEKKQATIRVLDPSGYTEPSGEAMPLTSMLKDMEVTVVHELVHLELASLPVSEADRSNQEYAIDHLTDALLQSSRVDFAPLR